MAKHRKDSTLFTRFLELLAVKHTARYSNQLYREHPYKDTLFGLSDMLDHYRIKNKGIQVPDKEKVLPLLECPFIVQFDQRFAIVTETGRESVEFLLGNQPETLPVPEFIARWTGAVLLAETDESSREPDYSRHRKEQFLRILPASLLVLTCIALLVATYLERKLYADPDITLPVLLNLCGMVTCLLLLQKQSGSGNSYTDKLCSLLTTGGCDSALNALAARPWGWISWSEMGMGYFAGNLLILIFYPSLVPYMALAGCAVLPYPVWSVWYQKVKLKAWCPLCLLVQLLLVVICIVNYFSGLLCLPAFRIEEMLFFGAAYLIPVLLVHIFMHTFEKAQQAAHTLQAFNSLKANREVFDLLIRNQPCYPVEELNSTIIFGNRAASTKITLVTNPHCEPCSKLHPEVKRVLEELKEQVCIQYVFASFGKELDSSNEFLIAAYFDYSATEVEKIYEEWFEEGRHQRKTFFNKYPCRQTDERIKKELEAHKAWIAANQLNATPTLLVNGYVLMEQYQLRDLHYLL